MQQRDNRNQNIRINELAELAYNHGDINKIKHAKNLGRWSFYHASLRGYPNVSPDRSIYYLLQQLINHILIPD